MKTAKMNDVGLDGLLLFCCGRTGRRLKPEIKQGAMLVGSLGILLLQINMLTVKVQVCVWICVCVDGEAQSRFVNISCH